MFPIISWEKFAESFSQGSKHWPIDKQNVLWSWFTPHITTIFRQNIKTDTLTIWVSFLGVIFYSPDALLPPALIDFVVHVLS